VAARQRARGRFLTALDKVGIFAGTLAAVVVIGVSACGAFVVTCMPIAMVGFDRGRNTYGLGLIAFLVGFSAALSAGYGAYRLMRRIGRRKD
jgi:hypothetical protein